MQNGETVEYRSQKSMGEDASATQRIAHRMDCLSKRGKFGAIGAMPVCMQVQAACCRDRVALLRVKFIWPSRRIFAWHFMA